MPMQRKLANAQCWIFTNGTFLHQAYRVLYSDHLNLIVSTDHREMWL
jgi:hypothetical protein